jgi:hypothetical protein
LKAYPVDLSIEYLGVNQRGALFRELPVPGKEVSKKYQTRTKYPPPEWQDEINYEVLGPFNFKSVGGFSETAFYHKATKSLLVTDTVVSVTKTPPPVIQEDPRALLFHARDNITDVVEDTPINRERGWRRMVQFGLVFFPSQIEVISAEEALKEAKQIDPRMANLGDGAVPLKLYPWSWNGNSDARNFERISQNGKVSVFIAVLVGSGFKLSLMQSLENFTAFLPSYFNKTDIGSRTRGHHRMGRSCYKALFGYATNHSRPSQQ